MASLNGSTITSAPAARAVRIACSISVTRYPVRSCPNGNGIGVSNANTERVPTGVQTYCISALLGTGNGFAVERLEGWPPNVAVKLVMKAYISEGGEWDGG